MSVVGAGSQNTAAHQTEAESKNIGMALGLGPFFSQMVFGSKYLQWCLGAGGQKAAPDQSESKFRNVDMAPDLGPYFSQIAPMPKFLCLFWELVIKMLRPFKSSRNPKMLTWLRTWALPVPKMSSH